MMRTIIFGGAIAVGVAGWFLPTAYSQSDRPKGKFFEYRPELVAQLLAEARTHGDARRGALVFLAPQFACVSCHRVDKVGGSVGPDLSTVGKCLPPAEIVEALLWPKRKVKEGFDAIAVVTSDGRTVQGYKSSEDESELVLREPATHALLRIKKSNIEERRAVGSLMPEGLAEAMTSEQRRDLIRFLLELGVNKAASDLAAAHVVAPAEMPIVRAPLNPRHWPSWQHYVNRNRLYDFYARQAEFFRGKSPMPLLLPAFPGLDGGTEGHWGNQNESTWKDGRWNQTDLGSLQCGVFRGGGVTVPRGVCVRLGDAGELACCFNPDTLTYDALWRGGFLKFSDIRHGFMDGLLMDGQALPKPRQAVKDSPPSLPTKYRGFYRHGKRVLFAYTVGGVDYLDAPWVEDGQFVRLVGPAKDHPLAHLTRGGPPQWPQVLTTRGTRGSGGPYVVDSLTPPFDNPWKALLFFGDHDFAADGTAYLCTMQGDVWRVEGIDDGLANLRWRRIAAGLHQALGLVVAEGQVYVLGRDQITRLHDLNGDGETDFYECFSNAYLTSTAGHDFICGLQRDAAGNFYTASGNQGLVRISADGQRADVLATGFRNPDGLGILPDGSLTVPCSEGEWTPASMICLVKPRPSAVPPRDPWRAPGNRPLQPQDERGDSRGFAAGAIPHFGYLGPKNNQPPDLPLVYLPRGLDNSSGGQVYVNSQRWGPLHGQLIHTSYGQGSHFLILRDEVDGQPQGAVVPLVGEFLSGAHRARFNPKDGQLYVSGMAGWGTYTDADGCFHRVRYTGGPVQLPIAWRAHEDGVRVTFTQPLRRELAEQVGQQFAQAWNYRYSSSYGSPEFSPSHPGVKGHDPVRIASAHVAADGKTLFLEIPDLQPVNQLHLRLRVDDGPAHDLIATVHKLAPPYTEFKGYRPVPRVIAAHPILADMAQLANRVPNPWQKPLPGARALAVTAGKNLTYETKTLKVKAGEPLRLTFHNPDVVPHNWVLIKPGTLEKVGLLVNQIVAEPDAAARHYVPKTSDVLVYTDIVPPLARGTIHFTAPREKGRYPFLCTFPGHWMVMNGEMIVE
ncbi:MAG: plastocyanin/azurin family copper-binding protein [Gemmataceae bacterium]|nr:plastocyanin/azurin family copper-binding protein [Gemmataceae bacterium]